jgi:transposase-like protein
MAPRKRKPDMDMTLEDEILVPDVIDPDGTLIVHVDDDDEMDKRPAKKFSSEERKKYALAMRLSGATYKVIAQQLDTDTPYAFSLVKQALEELGTEDLKTLRVTYQARLEQLLATRWTKAVSGDDNSLSAVLMILDRIERLYGLNGAADIADIEEAGKATLIILGGDTSKHREAIERQKKAGNSR